MGSVKSPCRSSYWSSVVTIALNCFVSEKKPNNHTFDLKVIAQGHLSDSRVGSLNNTWLQLCHSAVCADHSSKQGNILETQQKMVRKKTANMIL